MKKETLVVLCFMLISLLLIGCNNNTSSIDITSSTTTISTSEVNFDYLDQILPTNEAIRFDLENGNRTWFWSGSPVFSPNGNEMYWTKIFSSLDEVEIWYAKKIDGIWEPGSKLEIEGIDGYTNSPVFNNNADEMYFMNLSLAGTYRIFKVIKVNGIWSNPEALNIPIPDNKVLEWRFSVSNNKNVFLTLGSFAGDEPIKIYVSTYQDGTYSAPESIDILNGDDFGSGSPYIAFDESYILFDSGRYDGFGHQDIYVSFKDDFGNFMEPINLGNKVNTSEEESYARISEDGVYLFFTAKRLEDVYYYPYWIRLDELEAFQSNS
ncbi:MAG: hypothetical protein KJ971_02720 [Firmicutes bacterium]|nr:hypothetical protein [Bacillota bacterium]